MFRPTSTKPSRLGLNTIKIREPALRALLLSVYALLAIWMFPHWELTTDDGAALSLATSGNFFWLGVPSGTGLIRGPGIYYLYAFFFRVWPSVQSIQFGILFFQLLGHALLVQIGKNQGRLLLAYGTSFLWFFTPAFFVFYSNKFWEPALLPAFSVIAFWALVRVEQGEGNVLLALSALFFAVSAHPSAIALLPVLAFVYFKKRRPIRIAISAVVLLLAILLPYFFWNASRAAPGGLHFSHLFAPARNAAEIADISGAYSARHIGSHARAAAWIAIFFLVYVISGLRRFRGAGPFERLLFLWILWPLVALSLAAVFFSRFPHQWALLLFPFAWWAWLEGIAICLRSREFRLAGAVALLAGFSAYESFQQVRFVRESGGTGAHLSSVSTKQKILERIHTLSPRPSLVLAAYPYRGDWWYGIGGWDFLRRGFGGRPTNPYSQERFFYLYEESVLTAEPELRQRLEKQTKPAPWSVGPVTVFESDRFVEGSGILL